MINFPIPEVDLELYGEKREQNSLEVEEWPEVYSRQMDSLARLGAT